MAKFEWRSKIAGLWNATIGRLVPRWQVNRWVTASIEAVPVGEWAAQLTAGSREVGAWQEQMRGEIKREYIRQYLLGRGGLEKMTPQDWGSVGGQIADQYRYLDDFAVEVATGNLPEGTIRRRSEMYINSAREALERAKQRAAMEAEQNEVWWKRNAQAESCEDCKEFEEMGWIPVEPWPYKIGRRETTPGQGDTICLTSCQCGLVYRKRRHVAQKYSPDQPRVPAGSSEGGQWAATGGGPSSGRYSKEELSVPGWTLAEVIEGEHVKTYRYQQQEPDGFVSMVEAKLFEMAGHWEVTTTAWGNIFNKELPVYLAGKGKFPLGGMPPTIEASSPADAVRKGLEWETKNRPMLQKKFAQRFQVYSNSYNDAVRFAGEYKRRGGFGLDRLITAVEKNRLGWEESRENVGRLPLDDDGMITLYRGGSQSGLSWSTKKSEAERFARYGPGWGSVAAPMSGLVGIQAIRQGLPEEVTVHSRRFKASELLWAYLDSEGEVIVRPMSTHTATKGGPGSGHFGHAGRPGHVGGSAPGTGTGELSSDQRYQWHQAINMAYYDKLEKLPHGNDLLGAMYDAAWADSSAEEFSKRFQRPGDAPEIPRPKKAGTDEERMLHGIASIVKEWGEGTTAVTIGKLSQTSGLSERQISDVYEAKYRGNRILIWETRADLNQLRIGSEWRFDRGRGIVHRTEAMAAALRTAGYRSPFALWKEMGKLLPEEGGSP